MTTKYEQEPDGNYFPPAWNEEVNPRRLRDNGTGEQAITRAMQRIGTDVARVVISNVYVACVSETGLSLERDPCGILRNIVSSNEELEELFRRLKEQHSEDGRRLPEDPFELRRTLALEFILGTVRERWAMIDGQTKGESVTDKDHEDADRISVIKENYKDLPSVIQVLLRHFSRRGPRMLRSPRHATMNL